MIIEKLAIEEVKPYEKNAKEHPQSQINEIKESIKEFGNNDPIAIDQNNQIIEGHGRLLALEQLGYKEVDVIRLSHLNDEQRRAYILVHNKLTMNTGYDQELLEAELESITNIDMSILGFAELEEEMDQPLEEDDYELDDDLEEKEPIAQPGDIYQLGEHTVMCGDSTSKKDVAKLMGGELADLVVTDPPYNVDYEGGTKEKLTIKNDSMNDVQFVQFLTDAFSAMKDSLKPGGAFYIWHADSKRLEFSNALVNCELKERQNLIWVKNSMVLGRQDYQWKHEPCLYGWKDGAAHFFIDDFTNTTVIEDAPRLSGMNKEQLTDRIKELQKIIDAGSTLLREDKPSRNGLHPTMKPVKLIGQQIKNSSKKDGIVLDLFGGSGTTLIACEQLGRKAKLMEYDPIYVDVIIERYEELTGDTAIKISQEAKK